MSSAEGAHTHTHEPAPHVGACVGATVTFRFGGPSIGPAGLTHARAEQKDLRSEADMRFYTPIGLVIRS